MTDNKYVIIKSSVDMTDNKQEKVDLIKLLTVNKEKNEEDKYVNNFVIKNISRKPISKQKTFDDWGKMDELKEKNIKLLFYSYDLNIHVPSNQEEVYKFLNELEKLIYEARTYWRENINKSIVYYGPYPFDTYLQEISKLKKILDEYVNPTSHYFNTTLIAMPDNINGYEPYPTINENWCEYDDYEDISELLDGKMTKDEFIEWFEDDAGSDWNKMDEHGESYKGYYESAIEEEYDNAFDLTREKNLKCLCELPYSYNFIQWTIERGCSSRMESVRYSSNLGYWFIEKLLIMKRYENSISLSN